MKLLGSYINGNYRVFIFDDGTKIRTNELDNLTPAFPESLDLKVCNRCTGTNCAHCHECSTPNGELGDLNAPWLSTLRPYTELAIGGGNPLEHPDIENFLMRMKDQRVICSMTVHFRHFITNYYKLLAWSKDGLIHGLGISIPERDYEPWEVQSIANFPNAVLHVIAGVVSHKTLATFFALDMKLLILGYKDYGRGIKYMHDHDVEIQYNIDGLAEELPILREHYSIISFDNLAIKQLNIRELVGEEVWAQSYMGNDGEYTMYADLVKGEYAVSSTSPRHNNTFTSIDEMFASVQELRKQ